MLTTRNLDRCANLQCPNRAHEGLFTILDVDVDVLQGRNSNPRGISLVLCAPCGSALIERMSAQPAQHALKAGDQ